jgi:hypothetical protein
MYWRNLDQSTFNGDLMMSFVMMMKNVLKVKMKMKVFIIDLTQIQMLMV